MAPEAASGYRLRRQFLAGYCGGPGVKVTLVVLC